MKLAQLQEILGQLKGLLTMSTVLLAACLALTALFAVMRLRSAAGTVPRGEVAASTASLGFTLLTMQLCYQAWKVLALMSGATAGARADLALPQRLLDLAAGVQRLPIFQASVAYGLLALGLGMWLASVTEARLGEAALPRLRRITLVMGLGCVVLLGISAWSLTSMWTTWATLAKGSAG